MMPSEDEQLDGGPWQEYVDKLLTIHYSRLGGVYQRVPSKGQGDAGLEGFSNCGHGYQCYSDEASLNHKQRTKKQKDKITRDLKKLETNKDFWIETLQGLKLRRWSLVVPSLDDKEVIKHARKKAKELLNKKLPFIAETFEVFVETADAFPAARAEIREPALVSKILRPKPVTEQHVADMEVEEPLFIRNLDFKLSKAAPNADPEESRRDYLKWHLQCSNFLDELHQKFPLHWEAIDQLTTTLIAAIQTKQRSDTTPLPDKLLEVEGDLEKRLKDSAAFLTDAERITLAFGHVARWMGECSLFKGAPHG
ncbi:MAG: hypothetical protein C0485_08765 [Pirellula sp.]|nr:hypothetical protein [Pirellula sp.]